MDLVIKKAHMDVLADIQIIEKECFGKEMYSLDLITRDYNNELCSLFVGVVDGKIIGYIDVMLIGNEAELIRIAVLPQYQGKGLGTKMLKLAYEYLSDDISKMFLEVSATNNRAINMYQSFGFTVISRRNKYYADGSDAIIMEYQNNTN